MGENWDAITEVREVLSTEPEVVSTARGSAPLGIAWCRPGVGGHSGLPGGGAKIPAAASAARGILGESAVSSAATGTAGVALRNSSTLHKEAGSEILRWMSSLVDKF